MTTELLGLTSSIISDQQGAIVGNKGSLDLILRELVDVFLVVGDNWLGNGLTDGVDLAGVTTSCYAHADVDFGDLVEAEEEDGFVDLESVLEVVEMFVRLML
jgi:hypothetical protein